VLNESTTNCLAVHLGLLSAAEVHAEGETESLTRVDLTPLPRREEGHALDVVDRPASLPRFVRRGLVGSAGAPELVRTEASGLDVVWGILFHADYKTRCEQG
jgi:hypothetical protein